MHPEPVTVIAHDNTGAKNITDLKGMRLNIGNPGSGTRGTGEVLEEALGWDRSDLKLAAEMKSAETGQAVCDGKIDAYFWLVGHPSALTQESLATCDAHLVNVTGDAIDKLVADNPYYRKATIPAGMYNNAEDVTTFGVGATFVTSTDVPDRGRLYGGQGRVRQLRPVQEAAPCLRQSERAGNDHRLPVGTAA